jgi:hypothetical protein
MDMQQITIFLACSEELKADRIAFRQFISVENDRLNKKGIYLKLEDWENAFNPMRPQGTQAAYNEVVKQSDIIVCLFHTKIGPFTQQEFDTALEQFLETGKPLIYTYFKKLGAGEVETKGLKAFRQRLFNDLKHFYDKYDGFADLQNQFRHQLDLMDEKGIIQFQADKKLTTQVEINQYIKKYRLKRIRQLVGVLAVVIITAFATFKLVNYGIDLKPFTLKVRIENKTFSPELSEPVGELLLTYGQKTEPKEMVRNEAAFESIPGLYRGEKLRLQFNADGYVRIDTFVIANEKLVLLPVRRNNDLAVLVGFVSTDGGRPLAGVKVNTDCCTAYTDSSGQFRLNIPFQYQRIQQRVSFYKKGYVVKDITSPVIPGEPIRLTL